MMVLRHGNWASRLNNEGTPPVRKQMPNGTKFSKIMAAYDGSKDSTNAVRVASFLAKDLGADLLIVHAFSPPAMVFAGAAGVPVPNYPELEDSLKEMATKTLERGVEVAKTAGGKARGELLEGSSTVQALVEYAANEKVDLIVVGTRGMTGFKKLVLGSVSSGLVTHAHCSVLVVR
jgi:nucleotide-binding universal stress UspA family protein